MGRHRASSREKGGSELSAQEKARKDTEDKNFLTSAIHWYVEANGNRGFSEGSIIMAQTALELLYNYRRSFRLL